jgi:hypothetical protein
MINVLRDPAIEFVRTVPSTALKYLLILAIFHERNGAEACAAYKWLTHVTGKGTATTTRTMDWLEQEAFIVTFYIAGEKHARLTAKASQLPLPFMESLYEKVSHQNDDSLSTGTTTTTKYLKGDPMENLPVEKESHQNDDSLTVKLGVQDRMLPLEFLDQTARLLVKLGGVTYDEARHALVAALLEGDTANDIMQQIEGWGAWFVLEGITENVGRSIANNIRNGDLPG